MTWQRVSLADVCKSVRYGYTASASDDQVGPKFLRITDIVPASIDWESVPYCKVSEAEQNRFALKVGDIVVARTGATVGYAKQIRDVQNAVFASYLVRFRVDDGLADSSFVGSLVESTVYKRYVKSQVGGAAQPNANAKVLGRFVFKLPPRSTQRRIASVLSAYGDLIENNLRRIALLEEAARLLYREWFVHFRFPGHEHVKVIDGVPEGWGRLPASEAFQINPRTPRNDGSTIAYLPMASLPEGGMVIDTGELERREKSTSVRFRNGDTLFARITPCLENGKTGFVHILGADEVACGSTEFIVLRGRHVSDCFVYLTARQPDFRENAIKSMIGSSGRQRVQPSCFDRYLVPVPPDLIAELFGEAVAPMFEQINRLDRQSQRLAQARDLLLPRLMSGEMVV